MKSVIILLVAVGVAVADVSELVNRYLPPALVQNAVLDDFSVTAAPTLAEAEPEVTTTPAGTTVVEIEQVPLEEVQQQAEEQQEQRTTEQPSLPSIYEQPPALVYGVPIVEAQTEAAVAPTEAASIAPITEEAPVPAPVPEEVIVVEEVSIVEEAPITEKALIVEEVVIAEEPAVSEASVVVESDTAENVAPIAVVAEEVPVVQEAAEVPVVEAEPKPAHELAEDGYRYRTANRFRYRF